MTDIRFATVDDTNAIMRFMHAHWRADHILSRNRELFLYDFQQGDQLTMAVATDDDGNLVGLFGYLPYSRADCPDIAGSLWKALPVADEPMLGSRLREFVVNKVPHRVFCAPGAGLQTRPIYHFLRMDWIEMDHYYRPNSSLTDYRIARIPDEPTVAAMDDAPGAVTIDRINDPDALADFPFEHFDRFAPFKDADYVAKRYFRHPVYHYQLLRATPPDAAPALLAFRLAEHADRVACRIVDLIGNADALPALLAHLDARMRDQGWEYIDFVCSGFDPATLARAGMAALDLNQQATIIPNYFEPFLQQNVRVYAVADRRSDFTVRLCKADGDQDRPNQ